MKALVAVFLSGFCLLNVQAQSSITSDTLDLGLISNYISILPYASVTYDKGNPTTAEGIRDMEFQPLEKYKFRKPVPDRMVYGTFFLKFNLYNPDDSVRSLFFFPGTFFNKTELYKSPELDKAIADPVDHAGYSRFSVGPHQHVTLIARLDPIKYETVLINPLLVNDNFLDIYKRMNLGTRIDIKIFGFVLSGLLLMMIFFMGANYMLARRKEFLYNAFYSTCMFLLIFLNSYLLRTYTPLNNFFMSYLDFFLQLTGTIFYILFTRSFLNTSIHFRLLDSVLRYFTVFLILMLVLYSVLHFFSPYFSFQYLLENIIKFFSLGLGLFFIIFALKQRNRLLNYIAIGNSALVIFSAISLGIIWADVRFTNLFTSSLFYYFAGIFLELVFFLLGLTYKNRQELIERIKEQEALKLLAEKKELEAQLGILKAQQEERNRISADMHDDLGAGVTTIRLYSELARQKLGELAIPEIDKISASSDELLTNMNAIIWSMSSSNDTLGNTIAYIRGYALEFFENTGIECRVNLPAQIPEINVPGEIRRNVFLVVKEALHNILKHAAATKVTLTLERTENGLTLTVQDNGVGINTEKLRMFGNGLKNMRKRMQDIGGQFSIESNNGTRIILHRLVQQFNDSALSPKTT